MLCGHVKIQYGVQASRQQCHIGYTTVLVIIKLTKNAVALRLRCGSCKLIF